MPIIDSRSDSKFDALIRTNKADYECWYLGIKKNT